MEVVIVEGDGDGGSRLHAVTHKGDTSDGRRSSSDPSVGGRLFSHVATEFLLLACEERTGTQVCVFRGGVKEGVTGNKELGVVLATVVEVLGIALAASGVVFAVDAECGTITSLDKLVLEGKGDYWGEGIDDGDGTASTGDGGAILGGGTAGGLGASKGIAAVAGVVLHVE